MLASRRKVLKDLMPSVGALDLPPLSAADVVKKFRFYRAADAPVPYCLDTLYLRWASREIQAEHRASLTAVEAAPSQTGEPVKKMKHEQAVQTLSQFDLQAFADTDSNPVFQGYQLLKQQKMRSRRTIPFSTGASPARSRHPIATSGLRIPNIYTVPKGAPTTIGRAAIIWGTTKLPPEQKRTTHDARSAHGCQNPSLTYMAFAARAANYAADQLADGQI